MPRIMLKRMERACLKCSHNFTARGRFNRLCNRCKNRRQAALEVHRVIFPWD